ncbi:hypothetical protein EC968_001077 [Mortierella alpina]|nr:hypothetical protein EC968_001077 [Mortierella alpina]
MQSQLLNPQTAPSGAGRGWHRVPGLQTEMTLGLVPVPPGHSYMLWGSELQAAGRSAPQIGSNPGQ